MKDENWLNLPYLAQGQILGITLYLESKNLLQEVPHFPKLFDDIVFCFQRNQL